MRPLIIAARVAASFRVSLRYLVATQPEFSERLGLEILSQLEQSSGFGFYHGFDAKGGAVVTDMKSNGFTMHTKPQVWDAFKHEGQLGMLPGGIFFAMTFSEVYSSKSPADDGDRMHLKDPSIDNKKLHVGIHASYWNKRLGVDPANSVDLGIASVLLDDHEDMVVQLPSNAGTSLKDFVETIMAEPPPNEFIPRDKSARKRLQPKAPVAP